MQWTDLGIHVGLASDGKLTIRLDEATDLDGQNAEKVQTSIKFQFENIVFQTHRAAKVNIKGQHMNLASQPELEIEVGASGTCNAGSFFRTCIYLQQRSGRNAQRARAKLYV